MHYSLAETSSQQMHFILLKAALLFSHLGAAVNTTLTYHLIKLLNLLANSWLFKHSESSISIQLVCDGVMAFV